jgi:hypothetical protein
MTRSAWAAPDATSEPPSFLALADVRRLASDRGFDAITPAPVSFAGRCLGHAPARLAAVSLFP